MTYELYMSHQDLVTRLIQSNVLKTSAIIDAFKKIDRKDFVLEAFADEAYGNYPISIGGGQTISQPWTVAFMLELLNPLAGDRVLDIGSGSGWTTALLAHIVKDSKKQGKVFGIEIVPELCIRSYRSGAIRQNTLQRGASDHRIAAIMERPVAHRWQDGGAHGQQHFCIR
ncbi:MAG: Protein-L-isoaspartate(D-aspartate) O-methyltransferase [Parcubacteria group bacterium GW2011_GWB1_46_8]|nr:MAG: Protein-L-isoaspartate(D-aspartate) O-methyltransferase [Parcubacteria group bacterium GW2011_GWB1_46_8]